MEKVKHLSSDEGAPQKSKKTKGHRSDGEKKKLSSTTAAPSGSSTSAATPAGPIWTCDMCGADNSSLRACNSCQTPKPAEAAVTTGQPLVRTKTGVARAKSGSYQSATVKST